jgi:hypothetical protein
MIIITDQIILYRKIHILLLLKKNCDVIFKFCNEFYCFLWLEYMKFIFLGLLVLGSEKSASNTLLTPNW